MPVCQYSNLKNPLKVITTYRCLQHLLLSAFLALAPAAALASDARTGSVTIAWDPDPSVEAAGYRIHYGTESGVYTKSINVGSLTEAVIIQLSPGTTYYCVVTAYGFSGEESEFSEELSFVYDGDVSGEGAVFKVNRLTVGAGENVTFQLSGLSGNTVEVYASEDLSDWKLIGSYILESGTFTIRDPEARGASKRFYKVSIP